MDFHRPLPHEGALQQRSWTSIRHYSHQAANPLMGPAVVHGATPPESKLLNLPAERSLLRWKSWMWCRSALFLWLR